MNARTLTAGTLRCPACGTPPRDVSADFPISHNEGDLGPGFLTSETYWSCHQGHRMVTRWTRIPCELVTREARIHRDRARSDLDVGGTDWKGKPLGSLDRETTR